jgi:hypothetical protein
MYNNNNRIKVSDWFYLDEFFTPQICEEGESALVRMDLRLLKIADTFREKIGRPTFINNWINGGDLDECGWRDSNTTVGAKMSRHKQIWIDPNTKKKVFKAIDIHVAKYSGKDLLVVFKANAKLFYDLGVRRIEDVRLTSGWLHMDTDEHGISNTILVVGSTNVVSKIKV